MPSLNEYKWGTGFCLIIPVAGESFYVAGSHMRWFVHQLDSAVQSDELNLFAEKSTLPPVYFNFQLDWRSGRLNWGLGGLIQRLGRQKSGQGMLIWVLGGYWLLDGHLEIPPVSYSVRLLLIIQGDTRYPSCKDKLKSYIGSRVVALKVVSCLVKWTSRNGGQMWGKEDRVEE